MEQQGGQQGREQGEEEEVAARRRRRRDFFCVVWCLGYFGVREFMFYKVRHFVYFDVPESEVYYTPKFTVRAPYRLPGTVSYFTL